MKTEAPKTEGRLQWLSITGLPAYGTICLGQLVSLTGSGLSGFVLGVWTYQKTNSITKFGLVLFCTILPTVLILPVAGIIVDRLDRRKVMIFSDSIASLVSLTLASLLFIGKLQPWHIYPSIVTLSILNAFRYLSFSAVITVLVDRKHYGRGIGMMQFAEATSLIIAPGLAGVLIATISMSKIMLIDFATFLFSLLTLMIVRIPPIIAQPGSVRRQPLLAELTFGWRYIVARPGLMVLMILFLLSNFNTGIWEVLLSPLLLRLSSPALLGTVLSIRSVGILIASLAMSALGSSQRRILLVILFSLVQALSLILGGIHITVLALSAAAILISFSFPIINNCSQSIWQNKVPADVQGRVFATRRMFTLMAVPAAYVLAGGLSDHLFEPWMREGGGLAGSVGRVIGVGPNHGIALLFIVLGIIMVVEVVGCSLHPRIRGLERELPDAVHPSASPEAVSVAAPNLLTVEGQEADATQPDMRPMARRVGKSEIETRMEISLD